MHSAGTPHRISLGGEVVETFEKEGKSIAKISMKPFHLDIPLDAIDARHHDVAHLGDAVLLDVTILVEKIGPDFGPGRH